MVAALGIVAAFLGVCFFFAAVFRGDKAWRGFCTYSLAVGCTSLIACIARIFLPFNLRWFGLYEIALFANATVWFEAVSVRYLVLARG